MTKLKLEKLKDKSAIININNGQYYIYLYRLLKNYPYKKDFIIKEKDIIIKKEELNEFLKNWKESI